MHNALLASTFFNFGFYLKIHCTTSTTVIIVLDGHCTKLDCVYPLSMNRQLLLFHLH